MDKFKEYKIPHIGLKKEVHDFIFHLDETFFSNFEDSIIGKSAIEARVNFDKSHEPNLLTFKIKGNIDADCDKCAEILFIKTDTPEIDLSSYLYEFSHLCIPFIKSCEKPFESKDCDLEVASKLSALKKAEETEHQITDPRWEGLNKLKDK